MENYASGGSVRSNHGTNLVEILLGLSEALRDRLLQRWNTWTDIDGFRCERHLLPENFPRHGSRRCVSRFLTGCSRNLVALHGVLLDKNTLARTEPFVASEWESESEVRARRD